MRFKYYKSAAGREPALEYFLSLSDEQQAEIHAVFRYIRDNKGVVGDDYFKKITRSGIWEVRVSYAGDTFRFLCFKEKGFLVIVAHGFTKKSQKTPKNEIDTAERRMKRHKEVK